jgi:hypothetical protein
VRGYLASGFGNRLDPFTNQPDFHPGLDIATPVGARVQAPADGVVVSTGIKGSYGNAIVIDHGYGVVTRYGHLSGFNVRPGQRVRRGDVIGFVGQTGRATTSTAASASPVWTIHEAGPASRESSESRLPRETADPKTVVASRFDHGRGRLLFW